MGVNVLADINIASPATATGSWVTMTGMNVGSITVEGTNSVLILMAQVQIDPAGDNCADFRFSVNGSPTNSPIGHAFSDAATNSEASSMTLLYAVTGLSGSSNTFALEWTTVQGTSIADESRNRTFQILEITGGDATIKVDSGTTGQIGDPGSWGNLFQSTSISIAGTDSVILMLANVPYNMEADESTDFQFGVDDSGEGAVTTCFTDEANGANHWSGMHATTGLSTGDHSFELKWQARTGAGQTSSSRRRTFQVIEITANATRQINIVISSPATAGSWGTVTGLSDSYTVASTDAVALIIANMVQAGDGSDSTADFSIGVDGVNEGAELIGFADSTAIVERVCMPRLKTGLSNASHSFQLRWLEIAGGTVADEGRARSLIVIEFATLVTYKIEGITKDKDGSVLISCKCYLVKDNGDNTYSFIAYVQSDGATGAYSFTGLTDGSSVYQVVAWKDDVPHVMDVTDNVLVPVEE